MYLRMFYILQKWCYASRPSFLRSKLHHPLIPGHSRSAWISFYSYQFPSSVSWKKRQQIPNLYLVFFSLFLFLVMPFFMSQHFFSNIPYNSFGWVVKFCMCIFFVASVLSRFLRQQMTFVSLHAIFSNVFLLSCFHLKIPLSIHLNHIATSLNVFKQRLTRKIAQNPKNRREKKKFANSRHSNVIPFEIATLEFH